MINTGEELAQYIEFTNLDNTATEDMMLDFFEKAKEYKFHSVVVHPYYVKLAKETLEGTGIKVISVADFPLGAGNTEGKIAEAKKAIADGADEIDMMAKISAIKNHEYHDVRDDIKAVKEAIGDTVLKVIIECPVLTMDEIAAAAAMCDEAGADYVKTASGFNGNQDFYSLMESLRVIKKNAPHCKMKAAGGINNYKLTTNIIAAGVEKIGSSNPLPIIDELNHVAGNQKVAPGTVKGPRLI